MISITELCKYPLESLPKDHQINLYALHHKINILRAYYGKPMIITSGYRTEEDQRRIYAPAQPKMSSQHLIGAACDIADSDGQLKQWILRSEKIYERLDLYFESFAATQGWIHTQLFCPRSLSRFFAP